MTDILKGKIIVTAIKRYKNREEWTDVYVEQNYAEAIEYMFKNFDKYFGDSSSNSDSSGAGSIVPQGARIKRMDQGDRSIEYEYGNSSNYTSTGMLNAMIKSDLVLSSLLGLPLMRCI